MVGSTDYHRNVLFYMTTATIGFFDGVHKGHKHLIAQVMGASAASGTESVLVTFRQHPRKVLHSDYQPSLLTLADEKVQLLMQTGVDRVEVLEFTREMSLMSARQFMSEVLYRQLGVRTLLIGYDHRFGHNRDKGFEDYVRYGREMGMEVVLCDRKSIDGISPSSTAIRHALLEGQVDVARELLGYDYFLEGRVVDGFHVGRTIGYPTANLDVDPDKLIPMDGAYMVSCDIGDRLYYGMLNIGTRPTLDNGTQRSIEVHLFDYDGNLYDSKIRLNLLRFLRPEQKFPTVEELRRQLAKDEAECRQTINAAHQ